jgi:hypothetical protein
MSRETWADGWGWIGRLEGQSERQAGEGRLAAVADVRSVGVAPRDLRTGRVPVRKALLIRDPRTGPGTAGLSLPYHHRR